MIMMIAITLRGGRNSVHFFAQQTVSLCVLFQFHASFRTALLLLCTFLQKSVVEFKELGCVHSFLTLVVDKRCVGGGWSNADFREVWKFYCMTIYRFCMQLLTSILYCGSSTCQAHLPMHEITFSTIDKPKLLSQVSNQSVFQGLCTSIDCIHKTCLI